MGNYTDFFMVMGLFVCFLGLAKDIASIADAQWHSLMQDCIVIWIIRNLHTITGQNKVEIFSWMALSQNHALWGYSANWHMRSDIINLDIACNKTSCCSAVVSRCVGWKQKTQKSQYMYIYDTLSTYSRYQATFASFSCIWRGYSANDVRIWRLLTTCSHKT